MRKARQHDSHSRRCAQARGLRGNWKRGRCFRGRRGSAAGGNHECKRSFSLERGLRAHSNQVSRNQLHRRAGTRLRESEKDLGRSVRNRAGNPPRAVRARPLVFGFKEKIMHPYFRLYPNSLSYLPWSAISSTKATISISESPFVRE